LDGHCLPLEIVNAVRMSQTNVKTTRECDAVTQRGESMSGKLRCKDVSLKTKQVGRNCSRVKTEI